MSLKLGVYRHYKGERYEVIAIAKHEGSLVDMVVYKPLYEGAVAELFVRPLSEFIEVVEKGDYQGPRFVVVDEGTRNKPLA